MEDDQLMEKLRELLDGPGTSINIGGTWVGPINDDLGDDAANDSDWAERSASPCNRSVPNIAQIRASRAQNVQVRRRAAAPLNPSTHAASCLPALAPRQ